MLPLKLQSCFMVESRVEPIMPFLIFSESGPVRELLKLSLVLRRDAKSDLPLFPPLVLRPSNF